jgi:dephospho-CoA kinase
LKVVGLTGGIGSGKSSISEVFEENGIPVFNSDCEAKKLYEVPGVNRQVRAHFGDAVYTEGRLNFKKLAKVIFEDEKELIWINALIHPLVQERFDQWLTKQNTEMVVKESALLLETKGYLTCDIVIAIEASESVRIQRVMDRDCVTREAVMARIGRQATDTQRRGIADHIIMNDGLFNLGTVNVLITTLQ